MCSKKHFTHFRLFTNLNQISFWAKQLIRLMRGISLEEILLHAMIDGKYSQVKNCTRNTFLLVKNFLNRVMTISIVFRPVILDIIGMSQIKIQDVMIIIIGLGTLDITKSQWMN